ncbi:hypothetical protein AMECASPLE_033917 [Ameca splendens]|uniref:Integrin beta N-terminal domain-containing protein n=1 Tax=Ameca splendens TaxID=208324 RepID=A0ABV0ZRT1_9TELE
MSASPAKCSSAPLSASTQKSTILFASMDWCVLSLLLLMLGKDGLCQQEEVCSKSVINSCDDCIRSGPYCAWCQHLNPHQPSADRGLRYSRDPQRHHERVPTEQPPLPAEAVRENLRQPREASPPLAAQDLEIHQTTMDRRHHTGPGRCSKPPGPYFLAHN